MPVVTPSGSRPGVLPDGWRIVLDPSVTFVDGGRALLGGRPGRLLRLTPDGRTALDTLLEGGTGTPDPTARRLGRRLVDAGMAHPRPPTDRADATLPSMTVVVPVRDRPDALHTCLTVLGDRFPVVVVDDGSADPEAVAVVCRRHGARLLVRPVNGGPAAARNDAAVVAESDVLAFVDSDGEADPAALLGLLPYFADPSVGAVAPRVRPAVPSGPTGPLLTRFADARSALDMGSQESAVGPGQPVRFVPTTTLLVRRRAFGVGFDPRLRVGEDVDFVWRLTDRGWQVRYVPSVVVRHHEPQRWTEHLRRRFEYGTSAGPLARRHPGRLAPVDLQAEPTAVLAAALRGRPELGAALWTLGTATVLRRLAGSAIPPRRAVEWQAAALWWTALGVARATSTVGLPGLAAVALARPGRRPGLVAVLIGLPPLAEWWQRRPDVDPVRWTVASMADDLAYGIGVWAGCVRARTAVPLLPRLRPPSVPRVRRARRSPPSVNSG
ncbi:MAG: mycofactocin biosynthesis glycosyltransferase MftF [Acidimicrobiales bacterium]|nr:mycofactocin biosynthesis glycosyltransferase MftF [Acidimicrobiales bacterium]